MSQREFSDEELRALEAEMERITIDDVLLQTLVSLLNIGARKAGLATPPGEEPKRELDQVHMAIEGARALLPVLEPKHADKLGPVKDALSRLQMFYAQAAGEASAAAPPADEPQQAAPPPPKPGEAGPAQQSGRLWVPGQ
jgi:hypothetical protein